jgi:gamma-glutamyltranspeptidase/glutathione hydrolase
VNPYTDLLRAWPPADAAPDATDTAPRPFTPSGVAPPTARLDSAPPTALFDDAHEAFYRGTTSVVAADKEGWLVAVTPSGGWIPAVIAGKTGIGLSQRLQSFVLDPRENPFNVLEPGKRPRATLTPSLALRDGKPWLAFAVQGGDGQDQNLLQFLLNRVDFGMTPQQAAEAANMNSFQLRDSFGDHSSKPGRMLLDDEVPRWVRSELVSRGYRLEFQPRTSGPITAIEVDLDNGALWGGVSDHGEDHGIAW